MTSKLVLNPATVAVLKFLLSAVERWIEQITPDQTKKVAVDIAARIPDYKWLTNDMQVKAINRELNLLLTGVKALIDALKNVR